MGPTLPDTFWLKCVADTTGTIGNILIAIVKNILYHKLHYRDSTNDRIATQRYLTPEIPIGSRVMSRTTSAPTGGRARKVVAIIAGCRSFRTFRDCNANIAFTTVGAQPYLKRMFGQIWDRFEPKKN